MALGEVGMALSRAETSTAKDRVLAAPASNHSAARPAPPWRTCLKGVWVKSNERLEWVEEVCKVEWLQVVWIDSLERVQPVAQVGDVK